MRTISTIILLVVFGLAAQAANSPAHPNVIVIMTDDQGSVDAGCYGARDLRTPNLDALAARGLRFTQFYSAAPVCSPSRAGLLTGRYPLHCGLPTNAASQRGKPGGLPSDEITMAEMFKAAGYATAHVGKWHIGYTPDTMPNAQGFDFSFGHMGGCIDNWSHFFYWEGPNVHDLYRNGHEVYYNGQFFPDLMVREASQFMEQHRDQPFFLYFAINNPHYPYQPDVKWLDAFRDLPYPRNLYAAFVATLDQRIGALLHKLDQLGLRDRTIIVLQSDNGHSTEERAHFGGGSAGPYRGAKFSLFEGGIRLPVIVSWPGKIPEGQVRSQVTHSCDWLPTLAELCNVKVLNPRLDGLSLVPVLMSAAAPSPHSVLHWQVGVGPQAQWAVREGDWKLIGNAWDTSQNSQGRDRIPLFLSNLAQDPGEKANYASDRPETVERLRKLHVDWTRQVAAEKSGR
ncbi:MAG: sulfatase-like hydrolase/transferase [Candidatus Omnitrophica bacterium]|nr:sulfatase-like hydrolase/transferase [Candidatus Omnitrophota bacterium]